MRGSRTCGPDGGDSREAATALGKPRAVAPTWAAGGWWAVDDSSAGSRSSGRSGTSWTSAIAQCGVRTPLVVYDRSNPTVVRSHGSAGPVPGHAARSSFGPRSTAYESDERVGAVGPCEPSIPTRHRTAHTRTPSASAARHRDGFGRYVAGDAGYYPGPAVGGSSSLAVVGAYTLAGELAAAHGDHTLAYPAYEHALADYVRRSRSFAHRMATRLIPRSRLHAWAMTTGIKLVTTLPTPLLRAATSRTRRLPGSPAAYAAVNEHVQVRPPRLLLNWPEVITDPALPTKHPRPGRLLDVVGLSRRDGPRVAMTCGWPCLWVTQRPWAAGEVRRRDLPQDIGEPRDQCGHRGVRAVRAEVSDEPPVFAEERRQRILARSSSAHGARLGPIAGAAGPGDKGGRSVLCVVSLFSSMRTRSP